MILETSHKAIPKIALLALTLILVSSIFSATQNSEAIAETPRKGPRTEDLTVKYYNNITDAYTALKTDEIDILGYEITKDLYPDAMTDPNIVLSGVADTGSYQFDLNNNYTIHAYPGVENMFWYAPVRRAVAWCTDKNYIVNEICGGFAERIDAMIAAPAKAWASESHWYPNYPYEYDPAAASAHLDANGWVEGGTPNPHYDPEFPGSTQFLRVYPPEHSHAGNDVDIMQWYIRTDDYRRHAAGVMVADVMEKIGFQINRFEGDSPTCRPYTVIEKNYHLYTYGWGLGYFPLYLYTLYHSQSWMEGVHTPNHVTGNNASGLPNYPEYDALVERVYYPSSLEDAVQASKQATAYWTQQCINVPLFSYKGYCAYSNKVLGIAKEYSSLGNRFLGVTIENGFSFMNAFKEDGSAIRYGLAQPPKRMNPWRATWYYTYQNLDRCYDYTGTPQLSCSGAAQAGWLQDWEMGIWNDDSTNKTMRTDWVRNDSYFAQPVTGNQLSNVNASDYLFSIWYTYADAAAARYSDVQNVHHVGIHNDYSWTVYFNDENYWHYLEASPMLYPVDTWLREPLATQAVESFPSFTGPATVGLNGTPVWINEVTVDGLPLTFGLDYNLFGHGDGGVTTLDILTAQSGDLSVDYWAYGNASGFTPGELPWQDILVGSGMYYLTSFTSGVGGEATFKRNPHYWLETPSLGEVDYEWKWIDGPKPRSGYYKIDIYDVVLAAQAYGSSATGEPDEKWLEAADIAPQGGTISIYDIVTMAGNYGKQWGHTP